MPLHLHLTFQIVYNKVLVKAVPALPPLPFGTVNAVITLAAPAQGCYVEGDQCSKQDEKFHRVLLGLVTAPGGQVASLKTYIQVVTQAMVADEDADC